MDKKLDFLGKNIDGTEIQPSKASKEIASTQKRLIKICKSLRKDSEDYSPEKTVEAIQQYIDNNGKIDRILYSEISTFVIGLDEKQRATFSSNIDSLLSFVLDESHEISDDERKICIKIYDHFQLNIIQIENATTITADVIANRIEKEKIILHEEIKSVEKEYITILGIFAAIMLAFVGSFTFSTSVLNNLHQSTLYELGVVALIIGLVFTVLITVLLEFLRDVNNIKGVNNSECLKSRAWIAIMILAVLIGVLLSFNPERKELPEICNSYVSSITQETDEKTMFSLNMPES